MEILLLITIIVLAIAFINFKDYLNNPHKRPQISPPDNEDTLPDSYQNPYKDQPKELTKEEKLRNSEYGLIVGLLSKLAQSDGKVCELEIELMENTIADIANVMSLQSTMIQKEEILEILHKIFDTTTESVESLTQKYAELTKGQYKSRLKLVEYMLSLAYADGELGGYEREIILDVAAYLEIDNNDFNALYDKYEQFYAIEKENTTLQESYAILGVREDDSMEEIKRAYKNLVRQNHPDILHHKGLDESILESYTEKLQRINGAYECINKHKNTQEKQD